MLSALLNRNKISKFNNGYVRGQHYSQVKARVEKSHTISPATMTWFKWWECKKWHVFPVFHGFGISAMNIDATEHSTIKMIQHMMLLHAACNDTCFMIKKETKYQNYLDNEGLSDGQGSIVKIRDEYSRKINSET